MLIPDLSLLRRQRTLPVGAGEETQTVQTVVARRSSRAQAQPRVDYAELDEDKIANTPLIATVVRDDLPGPLKISNACFIEDEKRVREAAAGGLVVVVTDRYVMKGSTYGDADVAYFPFRDEENEPDAIVESAIEGAVAAVQRHWQAKPGTAVLVHCSAGQNRSGAVVLAVMRSYGVPEAEALRIMDKDLSTAYGIVWTKLVGDNGARLRRLVIAMYSNDLLEVPDDEPKVQRMCGDCAAAAAAADAAAAAAASKLVTRYR